MPENDRAIWNIKKTKPDRQPGRCDHSFLLHVCHNMETWWNLEEIEAHKKWEISNFQSLSSHQLSKKNNCYCFKFALIIIFPTISRDVHCKYSRSNNIRLVTWVAWHIFSGAKCKIHKETFRSSRSKVLRPECSTAMLSASPPWCPTSCGCCQLQGCPNSLVGAGRSSFQHDILWMPNIQTKQLVPGTRQEKPFQVFRFLFLRHTSAIFSGQTLHRKWHKVPAVQNWTKTIWKGFKYSKLTNSVKFSLALLASFSHI